MKCRIERTQIRILRKKRDFTYIDNIGALTNTFIEFIPGTELTHAGQYGGLIIKNDVLNFEAQISKEEILISANLDSDIEDSKFDKKLVEFIEIAEKILNIIKDFDLLPKECKSTIYVCEGNITEYNKEKLIEGLTNDLEASFLSIKSNKAKAFSYTWEEGTTETHFSLTTEEEKAKIILGMQIFLDRVNISSISLQINAMIKYFRERIIGKIDETCR